MHHWFKTYGGDRTGEFFYYKGLKFPKWNGLLTRDEDRSGNSFFAYFGGIKLSAHAIKYRVDLLIEKGIITAAAA